ncbi:Similar to trim71: E3 ubiquitin-protein ligase TRIM71 (Xenopus tropicalis) [Cotesia congregata]|uniref:Similar to trim71: E3 ubiquitin-protein ligase TRIM71 (Xenopus tropicalis) n=1 Tax=Cotesia congregata TaxID=51543 RepID=A0A8J2HLC7_COTCN|nr:Similar to trim71: E3 ubiquitin-protein ligase TRIM71 (Xenopus tropicalis) [Cotesia congregata]
MYGQNNQGPFNFPSTSKAGNDDLKIQTPNVDISPFVGGSYKSTDKGPAYLSPRSYSPQDSPSISPRSSPEMAFSNTTRGHHHHHQLYNHHGLLSSRALQRSRNSFLQSICVIHPSDALMYCRTCRATVCNMCQINNHHSHHLTSELAAASKAAEKQSGRILDEIEGYISIQENMIKNLKSANGYQSGYQAYNPGENNLPNLKRLLCTMIEHGNHLKANRDEMKAMKQLLSKYQEAVLRRAISQLSEVSQKIYDSKGNLQISRNPENLIAVNENAYNEISRIKDEYLAHTRFEQLCLSTFRSIENVDGSIYENGAIGGGRALRVNRRIVLSSKIVKIDQSPSPAPVLIIGDEDDGNSFCRPWGVACDKDGNIIVADRSNNEIKIYDKNGNFIRNFGTRGSSPGQFDRPAGIVVDNRNRIVTKYGDYLLAFGEKGMMNGQFNYPWDVAVNSRCEILVSDTRNHRVQLFTAEGEFLRKFGYETAQHMWRLLDLPRSVSFAPNGEILVSDFNNHHIIVLDDKLRNPRIFGPARRQVPFLRIQGMKVDDAGNVVVADSRNNRIQVLGPDGNLQFVFGNQGNDVGQNGVGQNGVRQNGLRQNGLYQNGVYQNGVRQNGVGQNDVDQNGVNQMDRPAGIAISPDGKIIIVDFGNNRVLVY